MHPWGTMQGHSFVELQEELSPARLRPYCLRASDPPELVLGRYRWNSALSGALRDNLGALEIPFRNRVHGVLADYCGHDTWYRDPRIRLDSRAVQEITIAEDRLGRQRRTFGANDVVAALPFGFWCSLFNRNYEQVLFPRPLATALKCMPRQNRRRKLIAGLLEEARVLRNRISHHEPLWNDSRLLQRYKVLQELLRWFAPVSQALYPLSDEHDFLIIYHRGPEHYRPRASR